jgi:predicted RNase H-like HicB family nuclease
MGFDTDPFFGHGWAMQSEIIFEVTEAEEGGYCATALGCGINTQAETLEELPAMVRDAVNCYFDNPAQAPQSIQCNVPKLIDKLDL